jgi:crotonyl-CoA carboxylase/reductase
MLRRVTIKVMPTRDIYPVGVAPPLGAVPPLMYAQVIRESRFGAPRDAFAIEQIAVPPLKPDEVLVYVMAAGINYNNVWAARGVPLNVIEAHKKDGDPADHHIGGSDASGVVYATGSEVTRVRVGDQVVLHCGVWDRNCPHVRAGKDPMLSPSQRIWGYETTWGSFAQFTKVQEHQCLPKPKHLTWEAAAAYMLVGATAYRMLCSWIPHTIERDDVVLIWGGSGGLGCQAIQIARARGALPVALVSSDDKVEFCRRLGAVGVINRRRFEHWGMLPHWKDQVEYGVWLEGARRFGKAIWEALGQRRNPRVVFEHPGQDTLPTSMFVCDTGGMVVICAGTTGYNATFDLRYTWMRQKRLQGSHFANDEQAAGINQLVAEQKVDPCLSRVFRFEETGEAHQLMYENRHPHGNMAILVGAAREGLTEFP